MIFKFSMLSLSKTVFFFQAAGIDLDQVWRVWDGDGWKEDQVNVSPPPPIQKHTSKTEKNAPEKQRGDQQKPSKTVKNDQKPSKTIKKHICLTDVPWFSKTPKSWLLRWGVFVPLGPQHFGWTPGSRARRPHGPGSRHAAGTAAGTPENL